MYDRKKWRSKVELLDVCFLQKMLSRPKDRSFTPPENLPGEGLNHTFIREKRRFSAFGQNVSWAQIYPRNEKTDQKTDRRRIKKMVDHFFIFQKNSLNLKTANFSNPSRWAIFIISKNSPGETGTSFCLKKEFEHRENARKEIRTSDLYSWPVIRKNQTGRMS